jgi:dolichyl-phosphate beta-glucosyltransferase
MHAPHLTVVIPAFNEGSRLPGFATRLAQQGLTELDQPVEFIVCDDGSEPEHLSLEEAAVERVQGLFESAGAPHRMRLVRSPVNQGKGGAIRLGWSEADVRSRWLAFLDADGAVSAPEFWRLTRMLARDAAVDVLSASRIRMAGRSIERSAARHYQGRIFATLVDLTFGFGFYDTQCGLKFFRASLIREHLHRLEERGWTLDIELLALARLAGGQFREEPIDWADPGGSKMRFGIDAARMFLSLGRLRRRVTRWAPLQTSEGAAALVSTPPTAVEGAPALLRAAP